MPDSISGNRPMGVGNNYQSDPLTEIKAKLATLGKGVAADSGSTQAGWVAKGGKATSGDTYTLDAPSSQPDAQQYQDTATAMGRFTNDNNSTNVDLFQCMSVLYQAQQETRKIDRETADAETALQVAKIKDEAHQLKMEAGAALGGAIAFGVMDFVSAGMSIAGGFSALSEEGSELNELDESLQSTTLNESPMAEEPEIELQSVPNKGGGGDDLDELDNEDVKQLDPSESDDNAQVDNQQSQKSNVNKMEKTAENMRDLDDADSDENASSNKAAKSKPERTSLEMRQKIAMNKWQSGAEVAKSFGSISKGIADFVSTNTYQAKEKQDEGAAAQAQSDHSKFYDDAQNAMSNMRDVQNLLEKMASTLHAWPSGTV